MPRCSLFPLFSAVGSPETSLTLCVSVCLVVVKWVPPTLSSTMSPAGDIVVVGNGRVFLVFFPWNERRRGAVQFPSGFQPMRGEKLYYLVQFSTGNSSEGARKYENAKRGGKSEQERRTREPVRPRKRSEIGEKESDASEFFFFFFFLLGTFSL